MFDARMTVRAAAEAANEVAQRQPSFRTVRVSEATTLPSADALDLTAPGRSQVISEVGAISGAGRMEMVSNQQALILEGPMPSRVGRSPWQTSNLT